MHTAVGPRCSNLQAGPIQKHDNFDGTVSAWGFGDGNCFSSTNISVTNPSGCLEIVAPGNVFNEMFSIQMAPKNQQAIWTIEMSRRR
jgi:hypothetical protein